VAAVAAATAAGEGSIVTAREVAAREAAAREAAAREAAAREAVTLEAEALEAARREASQDAQEAREAVSPDAYSPGVAAPDAEPGHTVDELTDDLRRLAAEYANYRKRVEREQVAAAERVRAGVLATLLPVLDDVDAAEEHGELAGVLRAVAGKLRAAVAGLGLSGFGEDGDRFDAAIHEAVEHEYVTGAAGSAPTVARALRRGYRLGDLVLRPAMVAVAEPAPESEHDSTGESELESAPEREPESAPDPTDPDPDPG
jgi:molecular chaperone GrpE